MQTYKHSKKVGGDRITTKIVILKNAHEEQKDLITIDGFKQSDSGRRAEARILYKLLNTTISASTYGILFKLMKKEEV